MKTQIEALIWFHSGEPRRPDADLSILIFSEEDGVISGYWDDEEGSWMDCTGAEIAGVQYWAVPEGPQS